MNGETGKREVVTSHAAYSKGQRCGGGGCPALYRDDKGAYFIIGRRLTSEEKAGLPMDGIEDAVEIPAELLALMAGAGRGEGCGKQGV